MDPKFLCTVILFLIDCDETDSNRIAICHTRKNSRTRNFVQNFFRRIFFCEIRKINSFLWTENFDSKFWIFEFFLNLMIFKSSWKFMKFLKKFLILLSWKWWRWHAMHRLTSYQQTKCPAALLPPWYRQIPRLGRSTIRPSRRCTITTPSWWIFKRLTKFYRADCRSKR